MNAVSALYRSTIGKKVAMALSGVIYIGWVVFHMTGNFQFYLGPEWINDYAHKLQGLPPLVWGTRTFLLAVLAIHVVSAVSLIRLNNKARAKRYKGGHKTFASTSASKSMRYGGIALLLFIIWHLVDFTVGSFGALHGVVNFYDKASLGFIRGEVYHNMLLSFGNPISALFYAVAAVFLGLHIFHGAWSAVQTLGFESANTSRSWRNLAAFVAGVVIVGNLSFPIVGFAGTALGFLEGDTITGHGEKYYGARLPDTAALEHDTTTASAGVNR
jgi:succinate dehydrogenase / fumarate reductase cytochrome b subunit